jgi:hypothetical protein
MNWMTRGRRFGTSLPFITDVVATVLWALTCTCCYPHTGIASPSSSLRVQNLGSRMMWEDHILNGTIPSSAQNADIAAVTFGPFTDAEALYTNRGTPHHISDPRGRQPPEQSVLIPRADSSPHSLGVHPSDPWKPARAPKHNVVPTGRVAPLILTSLWADQSEAERGAHVTAAWLSRVAKNDASNTRKLQLLCRSCFTPPPCWRSCRAPAPRRQARDHPPAPRLLPVLAIRAPKNVI